MNQRNWKEEAQAHWHEAEFAKLYRKDAATFCALMAILEQLEKLTESIDRKRLKQ